MAKKYNSSKKQDGEQKTTALSNMYDKLMAYAKVIEGSDWKMGWASTQRTWNGFPQNISGRQYTGGNSFYLMMATMANNHTVPIYATFNQIQKMNQHLMDEKGRIPKEKWAEAVHVRKGEQSEIVVFNTPLYVNPDNPKEKPLTTKDYEQLSKEEKEKYNQIWTHVPHVIFNIDQTNMKEVRPELYEKLVERMMPKQKQTFRQDTMGMYEEPAIDYILKNQTWRCPIVFDKESKDAFYRPSTDTITVPMKEQYNIPYTEKELDNDINKFITPALSMKAVITDFSDADRQMQRVTEKKDNKEYLAELRATIMLENTFGKQLEMLRQDGQSINDYAQQISSAITNDRERVITIKDAEAKIIGGQDYYTTFLHEGAHSMHKELNIELNATGDKRGYAREEMRVESSTAMVSAALGYSTNMFINSAAYVRGWNETANIQEKTKQMQQLISDINKTVNRMGEIIDDARIKVGEEPVFKRSNSAEQKVEQQPDKQTVESVVVSSTHTPEQSSQKDTEVAATPMTYTLLLEQMMKQAKVHSLGLPDGVKIDYDNDGLTVDKYKEGVKHAEFASLPKNEQDSLGWSATEILLETLQNTLKRYAEKTTTDLTVNLPNGDTVSLNKGNLDETYNHLSKLEKIGVLNAFASAAEADAEILFDNALKNSKDNKIFLESNNWIQKESDGSLSIVLVKDNETKKESLNDLNGLTQWSIVSFAVEENAQKIKQAKDAQSVPYPEQQTSPSDKVAETPAADQQASVAKSPDQQISPQTTVEPSQNDQTSNTLSPRQKLEAIGYPYSRQKSEDGSFNIPTVNESLYWRYAAGIISLHEAAQEFTKNGWTNFVDKDYTRKQFAEINKKYHKLDDDLKPLSPEQIALQKVEQQIEDFKEATGIQLEVRNGKPYHDGKLDLADSKIEKLPDNLTVNGLLNLINSNIKELPDKLTVNGSLWLENTKIERLPENMSIKGGLWLEKTNIERLPDNLSVKTDLNLSDTPIKELPMGLTVGKDLILSNTPIKELPKNLTVGGDLDLYNTPIKELPDNITIGKNLYLENTKIERLPDNLTVNGMLDLTNTPIKELPQNLTVNGMLELSDSKIERLSENLSVKGDLNLRNTPIKELPDNLTVGLSLDLSKTPIKELPKNLTVGWMLDLTNTAVTELPADLKVKDDIYMNNRKIPAIPNYISQDGYIDLQKANAPIQQQNEQPQSVSKAAKQPTDQKTNQSDSQNVSQHAAVTPSLNDQKAPDQTIVTPVAVPQQQHAQAADQKTGSPSMEESPTAKEYTIMWMTSIAQNTPKDRPSDIVFIKDFSLEDTTKPIYTAYGKDADRLAEKVSSSVVTMRPEIDGQRYPNATVNSGNIDAVRADMMLNNVRPVIIDLEGNRITNDKTLDYTKEERKAFLDSLKPDAKQRQDIAETIQRLGSPDSIAVPQLYNSHSVYAGPELAVPHRFGYQEVPVLQLLKSKNGSYRAGNDEDGYFLIAKMDTNNLYEVQKALKIVENNRPQKLIEELQKQVETGKASVEKDLAENHYKFTIYDQQGDLYYPRGNKSFTLNTKENDKIYLHPDNANYVTEHKVDPQLIKQLTGYAETKMGIQHTQSPFHKIDDFFIRNVNGEWRLSANIDGKKMPEVTAAHNDVVEYKHGRISKEEISIKTYGDLLNNKQEQSHNRGRGLH